MLVYICQLMVLSRDWYMFKFGDDSFITHMITACLDLTECLDVTAGGIMYQIGWSITVDGEVVLDGCCRDPDIPGCRYTDPNADLMVHVTVS